MPPPKHTPTNPLDPTAQIRSTQVRQQARTNPPAHHEDDDMGFRRCNACHGDGTQISGISDGVPIHTTCMLCGGTGGQHVPDVPRRRQAGQSLLRRLEALGPARMGMRGRHLGANRHRDRLLRPRRTLQVLHFVVQLTILPTPTAQHEVRAVQPTSRFQTQGGAGAPPPPTQPVHRCAPRRHNPGKPHPTDAPVRRIEHTQPLPIERRRRSLKHGA